MIYRVEAVTAWSGLAWVGAEAGFQGPAGLLLTVTSAREESSHYSRREAGSDALEIKRREWS